MHKQFNSCAINFCLDCICLKGNDRKDMINEEDASIKRRWVLCFQCTRGFVKICASLSYLSQYVLLHTSCFLKTNDHSHRMVFLFLILTLTSLSNAATMRDLCAKAKVQSMKRQQSACISKILDNLMSQDNQNQSEVCKIIYEATFECTQVFAQCQMHDEVK